jgi:hypothetical protein
VYQIFKKSSFSTDVEDQDELKLFKNIRRSGIFRVASHIVFFLYVDFIGWIIKHVNLRKIYICNVRGDPIASFRPEDLEKCYHHDKGTKKLYIELLGNSNTQPKNYVPSGTESTSNSIMDPTNGGRHPRSINNMN